MPRRENLQVRIQARDEASRVLQQAQDRVLNVNTASKASFRETGDVAAQTFGRISQDVELATADYERGIISLQEYTQALQFARQEALQLKSGGLQPVGSELKAFNAVMKSTGGAAQTGVRGTGDLRRSFASLAAVSAGLPGRLGTITGILSQFAFSSLAAAGVFAGLAAVGLAFRRISENAKEAEEATAEALDRFVSGSPTLQALQEQRDRRTAIAEMETLAADIRRGGTLERGTRGSRAAGTFREVFEVRPFTEEERAAAFERMEELSAALQDNTAEIEEERRAREELNRVINQGMTEGFQAQLDALARPGTLARLNIEQAGIMGPGGARGPLRAVGGRVLRINPDGTLSELDRSGPAPRAPGFLSPQDARLPEGSAARRRALEALRLEGPFDRLQGALEEGADGVEEGGEDMVRALAGFGPAITSILKGDTAAGVGSLFGGVGSLIGGAPGIALGIGGSLISALASDRSKNAMTEAHLRALRRHDQTRPEATIVLNIPNMDPRDAATQRLIDETRREAQARGYNVKVRGG